MSDHAPPRMHLDRDGRAACGTRFTRGIPRLTGLATQVTCATCVAKPSGYQWSDPQPHGTPAAYRRHYRHGEKPCEACRQAENRRWQSRRAARADRAGAITRDAYGRFTGRAAA